MMTSLRLPTSFAVIYGAFTLGLYVAIQGPTLMDLIDLLHVNNDIMSFSLAFASLAYSVGGLLSGFLFNYVNRQILIAGYFLIFGISNIATPFISNYMIFSVITVFKMMCAGGTDCGANVWILEMWPGQDSWLQALHFSFAIGCALGPLIVEPFLSVENEALDKTLSGKTSGSATISDQNSESRIHIPYGVSGMASILAAVYIIYLYWLAERRKAQAAKLRAKKQAAAGEHILLTSTQHPAAIEAGEAAIPVVGGGGDSMVHGDVGGGAGKQADGNALTESAVFLPQQQQQQPAPPTAVLSHSASSSPAAPNSSSLVQQQQHHLHQASQPQQASEPAAAAAEQQQQPPTAATTIAIPSSPNNNNSSSSMIAANDQQQRQVKITSKCREQLVGRPPYYVMFAIALAALCLSFYCGIEITSMNYLATFAVNIDLQLSKSTAAMMSSALTISFAVGRAFGIWIAAYMKPHKLFYLCAGIMASGNVLMLIFANTAETLLWYSICLFGIGCGPMFPAIVSFYDDRISKVTNTVSGIFILGSMFNVALNSLIIGHHIIDNALILIVCNLVGSVLLLLLFGTLHMLTKVKKQQRVKKFRLNQQRSITAATAANATANANTTTTAASGNSSAADALKQQEQQQALLQHQHETDSSPKPETPPPTPEAAANQQQQQPLKLQPAAAVAADNDHVSATT